MLGIDAWCADKNELNTHIYSLTYQSRNNKNNNCRTTRAPEKKKVFKKVSSKRNGKREREMCQDYSTLMSKSTQIAWGNEVVLDWMIWTKQETERERAIAIGICVSGMRLN